MIDLKHGFCQEVLKSQENDLFDSCVTDPPYGMNMEHWDKNVPGKEIWQEIYRVMKPGSFCLAFCSTDLYHRLAINIEDAGFRILDMVNWIVTTKMAKTNRLKPAHEPIVVAQKPYQGTLADNINSYGTGAININDARVPWEGEPPKGWIKGGHQRRVFGKQKTKANKDLDGTTGGHPDGRYPSNVVGLLDNEAHQKYFYAPRVTRREKGDYNDHPTVKPVDLMRWLVKIYTPAKGLVLDPFNGTGTTGIASGLESRSYMGIEANEHYIEISKKRFSEYLGHN